MGGMIPLNDSSRRPVHFPVVTVCLIITKFIVFGLELKGGDAFVLKWSAVAANITAGHGWITLLTAMFMHGSWLHILGNMVFLWAFGPEIEDAMNPVAIFGASILSVGWWRCWRRSRPVPSSTVPNLGASGAIAAVMGAFIVTYPRDQIRALLIIFVFVRVTMIPAALLIGFWFLIQLFNAGSVASVQTGGVAYLAHVGGFVFGAITGTSFRRPEPARQPDNRLSDQRAATGLGTAIGESQPWRSGFLPLVMAKNSS